MPQWIIPPGAMIDPYCAPEICIENMEGLELLSGGHDIRGYLCASQLPIECAGGKPQNVLQVKIRAPLMIVPRIIGQLAQCFWRSDLQEIGARGPPDRPRPHLVK